MLLLGQVAHNVLRRCGQTSFPQNRRLSAEKKMPMRNPVARRRWRSVIQDLMYLAARWTYHAPCWGLSFWQNNPLHGVWESLYERFTGRARPAPG